MSHPIRVEQPMRAACPLVPIERETSVLIVDSDPRVGLAVRPVVHVADWLSADCEPVVLLLRWPRMDAGRATRSCPMFPDDGARGHRTDHP
jgi:hypothetical protein